MWTLPAKTAFWAIVVHQVDADTRQIKTALLSLQEFKGSYGGEEQARVFLEVIRKVGLEEKLGFFTSDNHGSNDKMLRFIAKEIDDFDPKLRRVRCFGHKLNLCAQSFLFEAKGKKRGEDRRDEDEAIKLAISEVRQLQEDLNNDIRIKEDIAKDFRKYGSIGKLHNQNTWARASTKRFQAQITTLGRAIPLDNDTQWNSWLLEIQVALKERKEVMLWQEDHQEELREDVLTREDQ